MISTSNVCIENIVPAGNTPVPVQASVLRLDLLHPVISGNKWFKLQKYLDEARRLHKKMILTWGGAWSNHIVATAAACSEMDLSLCVLVRGEKPAQLSATLRQVISYGSEIFFIEREQYRKKIIPSFLDDNRYYVVPEGGKGELGVAGAAEIAGLCSYTQYSHILCVAGTGTMAAGLFRRSLSHQQILVIPVLRGYNTLGEDIIAMANGGKGQLEVTHNFHFGGYARTTPELIRFMNELYRDTGIPSDIVYTGKLFYAFFHLLKNNYFPAGSRVLLIHSGGLQGNASLKKGTLIF